MGKKDTSYWGLIIDKLHHELGKTEQTAFDGWVQEEGNKQIYHEAEKIHEGIKVLKGLNKESSWKSIHRTILRTIFKRYAVVTLKYAAVILITFLIGDNFHYFRQRDSNLQYAEVEVLNGQMGHLFLFDGTEVWLNSGSHFKYPNRFNRDERKVFLRGEAFFKVHHDKHLPFVVQTDKMDVEVLGTSFNVSAYPEEEEYSVTLEQGSVNIRSANQKQGTVLTPGQRASVGGSGTIHVERVPVKKYTDWKEGRIVFDAESLGEIARKLERWYNVTINFDSEELKAFRVTGRIIRNKPIDQTMKAIEMLTPVRYQYHIRQDGKDVIKIVSK
ncbi:MAG: FecR family protein [Mangrovibacterium sp.]